MSWRQTRAIEAPPFAAIANRPDFDANRVAFFLLDPHPKRSNMSSDDIRTGPTSPDCVGPRQPDFIYDRDTRALRYRDQPQSLAYPSFDSEPGTWHRVRGSSTASIMEYSSEGRSIVASTLILTLKSPIFRPPGPH